jgi:hypothetical protein
MIIGLVIDGTEDELMTKPTLIFYLWSFTYSKGTLGGTLQKKELAVFPSQAGMSLTKLSLAGRE